ncbi:hypothetical protein [Orenia marismortui]|uniref:Uncharacterized protein n=1 Tax=Orenia marismortui TaxID=46469 RepID=A0A4R8GPG5_9FIRM|nr:hypothetical protein [Orenia marismortui]TDX46588.1 hypothetical protein C7959_1393 [Orenia marismortui]
MSKVMKNIEVTWEWSGTDKYALKGFNVALTPNELGNEHPNNDAVAFSKTGKEKFEHRFYNLMLDKDINYTAWVQPIFEGKDGDWLSANGWKAIDDGTNTIESISGSQAKANTAESNAKNYSDSNSMIDGIAVGGILKSDIKINRVWADTSDNEGEVSYNPSNSVFIHPNGSKFTFNMFKHTETGLEGGYIHGGNWRYLAFVGSDTSRFQNATDGDNQIMSIFYQSGKWYYDDNSSLNQFTPNENDCIIAKIEGDSSGITKLTRYALRNAETEEGSQAKANAAQSNAENYAENQANNAKNHADTVANLAEERATRTATNQYQSMGALSPRVAMRSGVITYVVYEDNTVIKKNNTVVKSELAKNSTGTISVNTGDILTTNNPVGMRGTLGYSTAPLCLASYEKMFYSDRFANHTIYLYAPYGDTEIKYKLGSYNFTNPNQILTVSQGTVRRMTLTAEGLHRFKADMPIVAVKVGNGGDQVLLMPLAKEVLMSANPDNSRLFDGSGIATNNNGYYSADNIFSTTAIGDGSGSDSEQGVPYTACADTYMIDHAITGYTVIAIEPCEIKVTAGTGGAEYAIHNFSDASRDNPKQFHIGESTGSGTTLFSGKAPWRFTGTAPFYLRTNTPNAREYPVLGYRQNLRSIYQDSTADATSQAINEIHSQIELTPTHLRAIDRAGNETIKVDSIGKLSANTANGNVNLDGAGLTVNNGKIDVNTAGNSVNINNQGIKITESGGDYSLLSGSGIDFYKNGSQVPSKYARRVIAGIATDGTYINLNFDKTPKVITSIKSLRSYTYQDGSGVRHDDKNQSYISYASEVTKNGFRVHGKSIIEGVPEYHDIADYGLSSVEAWVSNNTKPYTNQLSVTFIPKYKLTLISSYHYEYTASFFYAVEYISSDGVVHTYTMDGFYDTKKQPYSQGDFKAGDPITFTMSDLPEDTYKIRVRIYDFTLGGLVVTKWSAVNNKRIATGEVNYIIVEGGE